MKHFKQKEKRKHSIKRQMIAVFAGMVICLLAILLVVNVKFLEPYYIRDKEMQFIHVYEELQNTVKKGTISNDEVQDEFKEQLKQFFERDENKKQKIQDYFSIALLASTIARCERIKRFSLGSISTILNSSS